MICNNSVDTYNLSDLTITNMNIPVKTLGRVFVYDDIKNLIAQHKIICSAAVSLFVFEGPLKAVLINYLNRK